MRYTVVWTPQAEARLTELWMEASDRRAVSESANRIDNELKDDPDRKGIAVGPMRLYIDDPLAVGYAVDLGDCMVKVLQVRRWR
ncbi:MAG TPA: hypothetical protein VFA18_23535 [Gemmataceae bacterium]|nr:hypothetical protein [Gemmataceae bacterium]